MVVFDVYAFDVGHDVSRGVHKGKERRKRKEKE